MSSPRLPRGRDENMRRDVERIHPNVPPILPAQPLRPNRSPYNGPPRQKRIRPFVSKILKRKPKRARGDVARRARSITAQPSIRSVENDENRTMIVNTGHGAFVLALARAPSTTCKTTTTRSFDANRNSSTNTQTHTHTSSRRM